MSLVVFHDTRTAPAPIDVTVGAMPEATGPDLLGAIDGRAKRTRPCCPTPLTRGNSPA